MFQAEGRGGAKLPQQELVDYVQRAEKSLEPGAESEKMKPGRWAGGPSPRALQGILRGLDFLLSNVCRQWEQHDQILVFKGFLWRLSE